MGNEAEIAAKFWNAIKADRTVMLGLTEAEEGHGQPMTAQIEDNPPHGPIWFFTAKDTELVRSMHSGSNAALLHFAAKDHDLFATVHGELFLDDDRAAIDRLWNRFVAAWFEGGKEDPNLQLMRFEPGRAQIWLNENSLFAGIKLLMGVDPKKSYQDKVAEVRLQS